MRGDPDDRSSCGKRVLDGVGSATVSPALLAVPNGDQHVRPLHRLPTGPRIAMVIGLHVPHGGRRGQTEEIEKLVPGCRGREIVYVLLGGYGENGLQLAS